MAKGPELHPMGSFPIHIKPPTIDDFVAWRVSTEGDLPAAHQRAKEVLSLLESQARDAEETGDDALCRLTGDRFSKALRLLEAHQKAGGIDDPESPDKVALRNHSEAVSRIVRATMAWNLGTTDPKVAARLWGDLVAAHANEQALRHPIPAALNAAIAPLQAIAKMPIDATGKAIAASYNLAEALAQALFDPYDRNAATRVARAQANEATPEVAAMFALGEPHGRRSLEARLATANYGVSFYNEVRSEPPTVGELEEAFALRSSLYRMRTVKAG